MAHHHHHDHHCHDHHKHAHHGHGHSHAPESFGKAFALGIGLNTAFVLLEGGYGLAAHSMALVADAGHNLSDVLGLLVAWSAFMLAKRKPSGKFTYGLGQSSILAALFNAVFLMMAVGVIIWEALMRLAAPAPVVGPTVMAVAGAGIVVNGLTAWLFARGRHGDLNIRGAYMHMLADALVSVGVVVAGLMIILSGQMWIDPVVSLIIAGLIVAGTWGLLRDSLTLSLSGVPAGVDVAEIRRYLASIEGVSEVHDLHVWPLSTTRTALTCHLVMPDGHGGDVFLQTTVRTLQERFRIHHATVQVEEKGGDFCRDCGV